MWIFLIRTKHELANFEIFLYIKSKATLGFNLPRIIDCQWGERHLGSFRIWHTLKAPSLPAWVQIQTQKQFQYVHFEGRIWAWQMCYLIFGWIWYNNPAACNVQFRWLGNYEFAPLDWRKWMKRLVNFIFLVRHLSENDWQWIVRWVCLKWREMKSNWQHWYQVTFK